MSVVSERIPGTDAATAALDPRKDTMHELLMFDRLDADKELRSPSGRYVLRCDAAGTAVITDTDRDEVTWRAGAAGPLLLGHGYEVQVEGDDGEPVWRSGFAAPGAQYVILTDAGELELLDNAHVLLSNMRTGPVEARALRNAAPVADITTSSYLMSESAKMRRIVVREQGGNLRVTEVRPNGSGGSHDIAAPTDWLEQEGTLLTWRMLPVNGRKTKARFLCLTDSAGAVLWNDSAPNPAAPMSAGAPYAYGGAELGAGGRLRHQSLTSPSGSHTLIHQENGDLLLHCHAEHRTVWSTGTGWTGGGWTEVTADGDLVVRNPHGAPAWSAGTSDSGARRLVVQDDGRVELLDEDGISVWSVDAHAPCNAPAVDTPRGAVLRRGQVLRRHSLTSADGSTVLGHRDERRLVLFGADWTELWYEHLGNAERPGLLLDEDGMLRIVDDERPPLGGPADELRVEPGEVLLCRADGTVVWRNGEKVAEPGTVPADATEDFEAWMEKLTGNDAYCATVVHDTTPDEVLLRLGATPHRIRTGTWDDLMTQSEAEDAGTDDACVAAFPLGPHTLLVEDNGQLALGTPELSAGTFAVTSYKSINADSNFLVFREGEVVADHSEEGSAEPTTSEVRAAMAAMGADDPQDAAFWDDLELLCRTAGVRPTVADVTGPARWAIFPV